MCCTGVLTWGVGAWRLSQHGQNKLRGCQQYCYQRIVRVPRFHGESDGSFFSWQGQAVKELRAACGVVSWDCVVFSRIHSWAGRVVRLADHDPTRLCVLALNWRGMLELRTRSVVGNSQGHSFRFVVARWEAKFFDYYQGSFGKHWKEVASDPLLWSRSRGSWLDNRLSLLPGDS